MYETNKLYQMIGSILGSTPSRIWCSCRHPKFLLMNPLSSIARMDVGRERAKNGIIQSPQQKKNDAAPARPSEAALLKFLALQLRILCRKKVSAKKDPQSAPPRAASRRPRRPCPSAPLSASRPPDEKLAAPISAAVVAHAQPPFLPAAKGRGLRLDRFDT